MMTTMTVNPTDQYILDATKSVLDDLPTEMLGEVLAYGVRVLAGRAEQATLDLAETRLTLRIAAALAEEPGIPNPDDEDNVPLEVR